MRSRAIAALSFLAGLLLIISGMSFYLWMPPSGLPAVSQALYLLDHKAENMVYVFSTVLSNILIIPVILLMTAQLYRRDHAAAVISGGFMGFAVLMQTVATLFSLARWTSAVPDAALNNPGGVRLFKTLEAIYLFIDLPGAVMFYAAAVLLVFILRKIYFPAAVFLFLSVILFIAGLAVMSLNPGLSLLFTSASICAYGFAYIFFYPAIQKLHLLANRNLINNTFTNSIIIN